MADDKLFSALHRYAPVQPRKARLVATLVRGLPVNDALSTLKHTPRRAAYLFRKVGDDEDPKEVAKPAEDLHGDLSL